MRKNTPDTGLAFGIALIICCWWLMAVHSYLLGLTTRFRAMMLDSLLDSLILSLPYFFVPPKWRKVGLWVVSAAAVLFEINVLYFRNFGDIPGLAALGTGDILNPFTVASLPELLRGMDAVAFLLPVVALSAIWFLLNRRHKICDKPFRKSVRIIALIIFVAAPVLRYGASVRRAYLWEKHTIVDSSQTASVGDMFVDIYSKRTNFSNANHLHLFGFLPYLWHALDLFTSRQHELSDDERTFIVDYIKSRPKPRPVAANKGKNLILIIVESLNSNAVGKSTTPALYSLTESAGTFAAYNLLPQIDVGGSSDGQFIINTGLLPLRGEPLVSHYASTPYPSLAKSLANYYSVELVAEDAKVWNHHLTTKSYGYDSIVDRIAVTGLDRDSIMMERAAGMLASLREPFFMEITTISMHTPYTEAAVSEILDGYTDPTARNYYSAVKHFDDALGRLVGQLKSLDIYDNTIIAITGDHPAPPEYLSEDAACPTVPLIVANAGVTRQLRTPAQQIDIFPTLLDVMGVAAGYRGVGKSLLYEPTATPAEAWKVSELAIRARLDDNFFEKLY